MGSVLRDTQRTPRSSLEKTKMLATILSTSLAALVAGSVLPHPVMPPLQERGECMAWSWSSTTGWKCTQELNTDPVDVDKFRQDSLTAHNTYRGAKFNTALDSCWKISVNLKMFMIYLEFNEISFENPSYCQ